MSNLTVTQNFLNNPKLVKNLIQKSEIGPEDIVYDLGAGDGVISQILCEIAKEVIAVEFDKNLFTTLTTKFSGNSKIKVLYSDILKLSFPNQKYKIFSNIPFNISSALISRIYLRTFIPPVDAFYVVQKEAAERFMGKGEGYLFSLLIRPFYTMEVIYQFSKTDFTPVPSVYPVLLRIKQKSNPLVDYSNSNLYRDFICFVLLQQKPNIRLRLKKIFSNLQIDRILSDLNVSKEATVKDISFDKWIDIFNRFCKFVPVEKQKLVRDRFVQYILHVDSTPNKPTRTKIPKKH